MRIEKNISIPYTKRKYPFDKMNVNDSFSVKITKIKTAEKIRFSLYAASKTFKKYKPDWKFAVRILDNEVRIWRIK